MSKIDSVIQQLNNISNELAVECPIISQRITTRCKPLTVQQQQLLIKNATGQALDTIKISNIINKIVQDNAGIQTLNIIDKEGVLLAIKMQSVADVAEKANMQKVLDSLAKLQVEFPTKTIEEHGITIALASPSLTKDSLYNSEFIDNYADKQLSNSEIISSFYIYDLTKYIESFSVAGEHVTFNGVDVKNYTTIVSHLPTSLIGAIADFEKELKEIVSKVFKEHNVPLQSTTF